ncbi:hypothetical protein K7432_015604 [Basidiobolus ranarum]|uniref:Uncharacterized protein n=1 Tax=Basidiobolus ranarum TaxID=34480 RepID=A0ABR2VN23_9FUNG
MHHQYQFFLLSCAYLSLGVFGLDTGRKALEEISSSTRVSLTYSAEINESIEKVWPKISHFDEIRLIDSSMESSCLISKPFSSPEKGPDGSCLIHYTNDTPVGSIRDISFADKHAYEQLVLSNPKTYQLSYRILSYPPSAKKYSPFPGSIIDEQTDVTLSPLGAERTKVTWVASFFTDKPTAMNAAFHSIYERAATGLQKLTRR